MDRGEKMYNWIVARLDEGMTVYATTYLISLKLSKKHKAMIRYRNGHCEVQRGRRWDSINGCKITAN